MNSSQGKIKVVNRHPDQVYFHLLQERAVREPVKKRLAVVNEVCRRHFSNGSKDFSWRTLIGELDELGGPSRASGKVFKAPYRELVEAWAKLADGDTRDTKFVQKEQHEQNTVAYLERHVRERNCLPLWNEIMDNAVPAHISNSQRPHYINRCVNL